MKERIDVPLGLMAVIAEMIAVDRLENTIIGATEDDLITIDFRYTENQVDSISEIAQVIEEYEKKQN